MSNQDPLKDDLDPLMKEALHWVVRLTSGSATQADARGFEQWRAQGRGHEDAFREAAAFRKTVRAMNLPHPSAVAASNVTPLRPRARSAMMDRRAMLAGGGALAASVAMVMTVRPPLGLWPSLAELTADYRTGQGERRRLTLAAGATVELNARSALSVLNAGHGVSLVTGEAYVSVPQAPARFVVEVGGEQLASRVGTFNLRTSDRETCVTCLSGSIEHATGDKRRTLNAGEQLVTLPNGDSRIAATDPGRVASWRQGLLIFRNTPLAEAVEDINRYRSGKIILASSALASRPVNGIFHTDQIDNAVAQLQQLLRLDVRHLPGDVILMG